MANSPPVCRAVLDRNVLVAAHRSADPLSPNRELIERWQANEFAFLFSRDTLHEYAEKLLELSVDRSTVIPTRSSTRCGSCEKHWRLTSAFCARRPASFES